MSLKGTGGNRLEAEQPVLLSIDLPLMRKVNRVSNSIGLPNIPKAVSSLTSKAS